MKYIIITKFLKRNKVLCEQVSATLFSKMCLMQDEQILTHGFFQFFKLKCKIKLALLFLNFKYQRSHV